MDENNGDNGRIIEEVKSSIPGPWFGLSMVMTYPDGKERRESTNFAHAPEVRDTIEHMKAEGEAMLRVLANQFKIDCADIINPGVSDLLKSP